MNPRKICYPSLHQRTLLLSRLRTTQNLSNSPSKTTLWSTALYRAPGHKVNQRSMMSSQKFTAKPGNISSVHRVFDIPELLELILSNLRIRELLRCQQVCHSFHNTTLTSRKIRQQLHLLASETSLVTPKKHQVRDLKKPIYNSLFWNFQGLWADSRYVRDSEEHILQLHALCHKKREAAMPEGSWRNMLVSQPPVKTRIFLESYQSGTRRHWLPRDLILEMDGPTMGDVVDELRRLQVLW